MIIKDRIPSELHPLIPVVKKWGVEDDGYRDEMVFNSTNEELIELINSISLIPIEILDNWLCDPNLVANPTEEYIKFSAYFLAYEYARALIENRI
jgi:hypothetical protein